MVLYTSIDGQWIAIRRDRELAILRGIAPATDEPPAAEPVLDVGRMVLDDDVELAMIGPPSVLVAVARARPSVTVHELPQLTASTPLALDSPLRLAAATGPRVALVAPSEPRNKVTVVRVVGRGLASQQIDAGGPLEFVVGLERNQLLLGLSRKLEVWDAVSARPLLRLQLQLPPPPRRVGVALGHLWVTRPGSDEVYVYRLSDGRPFRHHAGAPIEDVIFHPQSPVIVLVTSRALVRLNCFAHSLALLDAPWVRGTPLAQLVSADEQFLIGLTTDALEPWRVAIGASAASNLAPVIPVAARTTEPIDRPRPGLRLTVNGGAEPHALAATAEKAPEAGPAVASVSPEVANPPPIDPSWRDVLAAFASELVAGAPRAEIPEAAADSELAALVEQLGLQAPARRTLVTLYALYLVGEPALPIARLARVLDEWTEVLGRGELAALAMLRRRNGRIALRAAVTDLLDGAAPRAIQIVGAPARPLCGAFQVARGGRSTAAIASELVAEVGRIAIIEGGAGAGLLEARLRAATAVAFTPPQARPQPWPRDAGLIVVVDGVAADWVADLPAVRDHSSSNV